MGPRGTLDLCLPDADAGVDAVPTTGGDAASALAQIAPDVLVVLDPPPGTQALLAAAPAETVAVAFVTRDRAPDEAPIDLAGFARVIASMNGAGAWRTLPLPVADRLYAPVRPPAVRPRALFVGEDSELRDDFLVPLKHEFDLVHAVGGLSVEDLEALLGRTDAGIAVTERPGYAAPHIALVHLAAGQLLVADDVPEHHGLRPGIDFVRIEAGWQAWFVLDTLRGTPDAFRSMRVTGRRSAERYRASRVWPQLAADVLADVRVFG
jgi:sarcosine oxidase gamma subunit